MIMKAARKSDIDQTCKKKLVLNFLISMNELGGVEKASQTRRPTLGSPGPRI